MSNDMSLQDFIETTLDDICSAVESVRTRRDYVAPKIFVEPTSDDKATIVSFDIAVSVSEQANESAKKEGKAEAKIRVLSLGASVGGGKTSTKSDEHSTVSRISFSVPVFFQFDKNERERRMAEREKRKRRDIELVSNHNNGVL